MAKLTVILVDDDPSVRDVVSAAFAAEPDLELVASTEDPYAAFELWRAVRPDVVILDEHTGALTGTQVAERILHDDPDQPIIIFTGYPTRGLLEAASTIGVRDVTSKTDVAKLGEVVRRHAVRSNDAPHHADRD